jgi:hypothetical protein
MRAPHFLWLATLAGAFDVQQDLVAYDLNLGCTIDLFLNAPSDTQTYALYGDKKPADMYIPASFQYPAPFGRSVGQPDAFLTRSTPGLQKDSFLTIGDEDNGLVSSVGVDFDTWTDSTPLRVTDGAVFILDPDRAPRGRVRLARLTVPKSSPMRFHVQGQHYQETGADSDRLRSSYNLDIQCLPAH